MASTIQANLGIAGLTGLVATLTSFPGDTVLASNKALTELTNSPGFYNGTVSEAVTGAVKMIVRNASAQLVGTLYITDMADDTGTYAGSDFPPGIESDCPTAAAIAAEVDTVLSGTHGAGAWGPNSGSGAFNITVTVTDGTDPLQNALVQVSDGVTALTLTTDASGNATFGLNANTYTVSLWLSGYSFTPTTRTVTGEQAGTLTNPLAMAQVVIPPASPPFTTGFLTAYDNTMTAEPNVRFTFQLLSGPDDDSLDGQSHQSPFAVQADSDGTLELTLLQSSNYQAKRGPYDSENEWKEFTTGTDPTFAIPLTIGMP